METRNKKIGTLVFIIKNGRVLLAKKSTEKHTNVGAISKWNGYGGVLEKDCESIEDCVVREFSEEAGGAKLEKSFLLKVAEITFLKSGKNPFECHVYISDRIIGEVKSSKEMIEPTWFYLAKLPPISEFIKGDYIWLFRVLKGEKLKGEIYRGSNDELISYNISTVGGF